MRWIEVSRVWDLHKYAEKTYALGQHAPTQEFDSAVGHLIRCWDDLCNFLEELGKEAAKRQETNFVEGLNEAGVLGMTKAAVYAIDSARIYHKWEYRGDLPKEREFFSVRLLYGGSMDTQEEIKRFPGSGASLQEGRNHPLYIARSSAVTGQFRNQRRSGPQGTAFDTSAA